MYSYIYTIFKKSDQHQVSFAVKAHSLSTKFDESDSEKSNELAIKEVNTVVIPNLSANYTFNELVLMKGNTTVNTLIHNK